MSWQHERRSVIRRGGAALAGTGLFAGCSQVTGGGKQTSGSDGDSFTVGSWTYTEQLVLGWLSFEVLDANTDLSVTEEISYGGGSRVFNGFKDRVFDLFWSYTGTVWMANPPQHEEPVLESQQAQYDALKEEMESEHDMTLLEMTSFENAFTFMMTPERSNELGIENLSDLADYVNAGNYDLTVAVQPGFLDRPAGWDALVDAYGFEDEHVTAWEENDQLQRIKIGLIYDQVNAGRVDIGLGYMTNANISNYGLKLIDDDQNFWPYYNLVPVLASESATEAVTTELNKVPSALEDASTMQQLNARVDVDGEEPRAVAQDFLESEGII